jgi:fibronectin type 3 domain-containing protein
MKKVSNFFNIKRISLLVAVAVVAILISASALTILGVDVTSDPNIAYTVKITSDSSTLDISGTHVGDSGGKIVVLNNRGRVVSSSTDSSTALQWAIDHTSSGKSIVVNAGRYVLTKTIKLYSGVVLVGNGDKTVLVNGELNVCQSNVVIKSLRMEGTCHVAIRSGSARISNILIDSVSATTGITQNVFSIVANNYKVSNVKFIKCTVTNSSAYGFRLMGNALISDVTFDSCRATGLGLNSRPDDHVAGFDLVNTNVANIKVLRSESSRNWDNGFCAYNHNITITQTNVMFQNCIANSNGKKPGQSEGYGYKVDPEVILVNSTGAGNAGGLTNLLPDPEPSKVVTKIDIGMISSIIPPGRNMHATCQLARADSISTPIPGATIQLSITLPDGTNSYIDQGEAAVTDDQGTFAIDYTPTVEGSYAFKATYAGNSTYNATSIVVAFEAKREPLPTPSLTAAVSANPTSLHSRDTSAVMVHVTNGTVVVAGASVSLSSDNGGTFSSVSYIGSGDYRSTFTAPTLSTQVSIHIAASVTKSGYDPGTAGTDVIVIPLTVPSAPTMTSATPGNGQVVISWTAPSDGGSPLIGYKLFRGTTSGDETLLNTLGSVLTYTDSSLINGQVYYYKVSALNSVGEGPQSNEISATPVSVPSAPPLVSATPGNAQVTLAWTAPSDNGGSAIADYKVYRGTAAGAEGMLIKLGNVLIYTDASLTNGQTYYYKVSASSAQGESPKSNELSAKPVGLPTAPQNLHASPGNAYINLSWSAPSGTGGSAVTNFQVWRALSSGAETFLANAGLKFWLNDTGLTNGQVYYYKLRADNAQGSGPDSDEASGIPSLTATVATAPQSLSATAGNYEVILTWAVPSSDGGASIIGYKLYRGGSSGGESLLATLGTVLTYIDSSVINGATYYYKVSALNSVGEGPQSIEVSATPATTPSSPTNLVATPGNAQVNLTWTAPSSDGGVMVSGYRIYRGTVSGGEALLITLGSVLSYTDSLLANGQIYYYKLTALNSVGEGPQSSEANAKPVSLPSASTLSSVMPGNTQTVLAWTAPSNNGGSAITNYKVYRGTTAGGEILLTTLGNVLTYTDSSLTNGQAYYYKVSAVNSVGEGPKSNEASATPAAVPSAPTLSSATPGNAQMVLTWTAPSIDGGSPISGYKVYRGTISGGEALFTTLGNVMTYTDVSLTNGQIYFYMIAAVNSQGVGAQSNELSSTPTTTPSAPNLISATPGNSQVALAWAAPSSNGGSAVTGYKVYRGTASGGETLLTSLGSVLAYTDASLTNGQIYYYKVSAMNSAGEGPQSNELGTTPGGLPGSPTLNSATPGNSQIALVWSAPANDGGSPITSYKVNRGTSAGGETLLTTIGNVLTYTDTSLTNGQKYYYKVSAANSVGQGALSNELSATPATVPSAPNLSSATPGNGQAVLAWTAPSNGGASITGYKVYRGSASGGETLLTTLGIVLAYTDTSLTNGQTYYYKVSAVNSLGEGLQSNERSATPGSVPLAPTLSTATPSPGQVVLVWSAPSSNGGSQITNYRVYRGTSSGGETLLTTLGNVLTYTNTGLTNGQAYYYKVTATNSIGEGAQSNELSALPVSVPSAPTLTSSTPGNAQMTLAWTVPSSNGGSAITNYKVYRGSTSGGETILTTLGNVLTYTDSSLTNGQTYYYKVSAVSTVGEGPRSNEGSGTPNTGVISPSVIITVSGTTYTAKNYATGATISSGTNAATVINAGINALTAGRTTKQKVLLQGMFTINNPIIMTSYTILELQGKVTMANAAGEKFMVSTSGRWNEATDGTTAGAKFFEMVGGEWDANNAGQSTHGHTDQRALNFVACTDFIIRDLTVHDSPAECINCLHCDRVTISNVYAHQAQLTVCGMPFSSNCLIENCHFTDGGGGGVYFYCEDDGMAQHVDNNIIRGCIAERTQLSGLSISLRGLEDTGDNGLIEGNTVIDCGLDGEHPGINLGWSGSDAIRYATNCAVRNNTVYETGDYYSDNGVGAGMELACHHSQITNNTLYDITDVGIDLRGDYNSLSTNRITNCGVRGGYPGLQIFDGNHNEIVSNTIKDCLTGITLVTEGMTSGCSYNHIASNRIENMDNYCVSISNSGSTANIIENNVFVGGSSINNKGTGTIIRNNTNS